MQDMRTISSDLSCVVRTLSNVVFFSESSYTDRSLSPIDRPRFVPHSCYVYSTRWAFVSTPIR